jgi:hypothetical protein
VDQLESALPTTHQCYDWRLLYRLSRDGASLHTLLLSARNHTSYLLVVKVRAASIHVAPHLHHVPFLTTHRPSLMRTSQDAGGAVFGGFITDKLRGAAAAGAPGGGLAGSLGSTKTAPPLRPAHALPAGTVGVIGGGGDSDGKYHGNGTVAVWSFAGGSLAWYASSNKNPYFLLSSPDALAMGGGKNFAFFLDADLHTCSSGECETFDSPCLASADQVTCVDCELFGFESPLP